MDCAPAELLAGVSQITCIVPQSSLIVPLVSIVTAIIAAWLALQSIENARDIARRKATLDLIEKTESSEHYRQLVETFLRIKDEGLFVHMVDKSVAGLLPERGALIDYLNHYELVAIGVRNGVLDADMYRLWMQSAFVDTWNDAAAWVQAIRLRGRTKGDPQAYNHKAYEHFAHLAARWSPMAVRLTADSPEPLKQKKLTDAAKLARVIAARPKAKT
jgi:hypothetical protein